MAKINITIDDELLKKIEEYAARNFMSKSAFFAQCAVEQINRMETINMLNDINELMAELGDKEVDAKTRKKLNELIYLTKNLMRNVRL